MIALDTNVLLHFLVVDEETPVHSLAARGAVDDALGSGEIVLDQRGALLRWRNGPADFTDYLGLELALGAGARELLSFDRQLLRAANVTRPGA